MNKAIFIDKDGTLIPEIPHNNNSELVQLENGVADGLCLLKKQHFLLIIISNQPGFAYGSMKETDMVQVQKKILQLLKPFHVSINGFYYCPHHPQGTVNDYSVNCFCRKPQPGLLLRAAKDFNIDLSKSWLIGDILNDMEAGKRAGCKTVLVNNGNEIEWEMNNLRVPDYEVSNFADAASFIVNGIDQIPIKRANEQRLASM